MTASKSLPPRPSLESLRKQAKKLARDRSLSLRDAQLSLAREYGYAGWRELTAEVSKRLGKGLEWVAAQARQVIHDNDLTRLTQLLTEFPALLSWRSSSLPRGLLGFATGSFGDSFDSFREQQFTRFACAELLLDAGAEVMPSICDDLLQSRARRLLQLFRKKDLLPRTLKFFVAFDDVGAVRAALDQGPYDLAAVNDAFVHACGFEHETVASLVLDRLIALDPKFGAQVDGGIGRSAFIKYFVEKRPAHATEVGVWNAFVMEQVSRAVCSWSGHRTSVTTPMGESDLTEFVRLLRRESWLLGEAFVDFQVRIIERATLNDREEFIEAILDLQPAILQRQPPPPSQAVEFAFTYAKTRLLPSLTRIWPVPDVCRTRRAWATCHESSSGSTNPVRRRLATSRITIPVVRTCRRTASRNMPASGVRKACSAYSTSRSPGPS